MPSDFQLKMMNGIHRVLMKATGGRAGRRLMGMLVLELFTIGAKSGQERASMLTSPVQRGDEIVIVASRGGDPTHPGWYHNIKANPDVEIVMDNTRRPMRARVATPDEKQELWPQVTSAYKGYAGYQKKTTRDIPLVILSPR